MSYLYLIVVVFLTFGLTVGEESLNCYTKWISGYRLASGRAKKIIHSVSLKSCEEECIRSIGCAAFAYGKSGSINGTCELATTRLMQIEIGRDSRSLENNTILLKELDTAPPYDVYIAAPGKDDHCLQRSPLFRSYPKIDGTSVPIDCFYRLMSGKRLGERHALKSISVNSLQECQEQCIVEKSFDCRSVSYRYKPSGFSYTVRNCQLSSYHLSENRINEFRDPYRVNEPGLIATSDLIEDFEYNYFQKETFCRDTTASPGFGTYGVCSAIISSGKKMKTLVVKSSHQVSTASQCEHLCASSLFRCRGFAFRHTQRGHLSSNEPDRYGDRSSCLLTESDLSMYSSYNIESDPDYDLFEMGRQIDGKCVLHDRFETLSKRPNTMDMTSQSNLLTSSTSYHSTGYRDYYNRPPANSYNPTSQWNRPQGRDDYHHHHQQEACLVQLRADAYLLPEASQATFPVKTLEECKIECLRSDKVLKITCRVMAFRVTSETGGMCQISEVESRNLNERDYIPARDRYERAMILYYDERNRNCLRPQDRYAGNTGINYPGGYQQHGRYPLPLDSSYHSSSYDSNRRYYDTPYNRYDNYYDYRPQQGLSVGGPSHSTYPIFSQSKGYYDDRYGQNGGRYNGFGSSYPSSLASSGSSDYYGQGGWTTVDGERCQQSCTMHRDAGFYYCQIDRDGSWNFCCRPDEGGQCGSSRGLSFSWCYVGTGASHDSWRTCSPTQNFRVQKNLNFQKGPQVAYLHAAQPPPIHTLTNINDIANLTRDDAVMLFNKV